MRASTEHWCDATAMHPARCGHDAVMILAGRPFCIFSFVVPALAMIVGFSQDAYGHTAPNTWCFLTSSSSGLSWEVVLFLLPALLLIMVSLLLLLLVMIKGSRRKGDADAFKVAVISRSNHAGGVTFVVSCCRIRYNSSVMICSGREI